MWWQRTAGVARDLYARAQVAEDEGVRSVEVSTEMLKLLAVGIMAGAVLRRLGQEICEQGTRPSRKIIDLAGAGVVYDEIVTGKEDIFRANQELQGPGAHHLLQGDG